MLMVTWLIQARINRESIGGGGGENNKGSPPGAPDWECVNVDLGYFTGEEHSGDGSVGWGVGVCACAVSDLLFGEL
jgi:hypothetical protein